METLAYEDGGLDLLRERADGPGLGGSGSVSGPDQECADTFATGFIFSLRQNVGRVGRRADGDRVGGRRKKRP